MELNPWCATHRYAQTLIIHFHHRPLSTLVPGTTVRDDFFVVVLQGRLGTEQLPCHCQGTTTSFVSITTRSAICLDWKSHLFIQVLSNTYRIPFSGPGFYDPYLRHEETAFTCKETAKGQSQACQGTSPNPPAPRAPMSVETEDGADPVSDALDNPPCARQRQVAQAEGKHSVHRGSMAPDLEKRSRADSSANCPDPRASVPLGRFFFFPDS
ncbi:hypothetical protein QBC32DRAFT_142864 [Pseudoneurospora amorphoporcata]|uniref:Uncharacterized protein n=1 Tax=Pseudoneurospora amorphoporcata TaxID=241081 RepID=A0AAN6SGT3_9PEZI|nr:hypothetical protein QBC32DRAFT_142864 [Pseudoneurospora amorphoporcata]